MASTGTRSSEGRDALRWLEGRTVAFVGDSITADLTANYVTLTVDRLAQEVDITRVRIVNSGVDSSSIFDALDRLPDILIEHEPDVFVVLVGVNDSKIVRHVDLPLVPPEAFDIAYGAFLDRIDVKRVVPKILITPPAPLYKVVLEGALLAEYWYWKEDLFGRYVDSIRRMAARPSCVVADACDRFLNANDRERMFGPDGVHPNILGHRILAEEVLEALRKCKP
jgi:lysophospholipase L1-like esterase